MTCARSFIEFTISMGRHSSDSEKDRKKIKKKKKKRSRSRSKSAEKVYSSKLKKSKKSKKKHKSRSRSRSVDSYGRLRSRSRGRRSRSYDRYHSRSRSRSKYSRRSRSLSRGRYERSRSRDKRKRRSRSYDRYSRRSRSRSTSRRDRGKTSEERADPCLTIPGFSELPPSEQAKIRMQMALKAAAAADEKIKADNTPYQGPSSLKDQLIFNKALKDIESSGFKVHNFKSNQREKKEQKTNFNEDFTFGTAGEIGLDSSQRNPVLINVDTDELADPSLYVDPEVKMEKWIQKLSAMRRKKLEGEVLS